MAEKIAAESISKGDQIERSELPQARAFIIDDDPLQAGLLARRLERRGLKTFVCDNPDRIVDDICQSAPEVVFCDLQMPQLNGAEIISLVRRRGFAGMVVLVTASRDQKMLNEAIRCGADIVLAKPPRDYDLDWLAEKVRFGLRNCSQMEAISKLIEYVDHGAVVLDEETLPICMNERARLLLGIDDVKDFPKAIEMAGLDRFLFGEPSRNIVFVEPNANKSDGEVLIAVEMQEANIGSRKLRILLLRDFSERRRLDNLQTQVAAYLSHSIRTPLTSMRNAISILRGPETPVDENERRRLLDIAHRSVERMVGSLEEAQRSFMAGFGAHSGFRALVDVGKIAQEVLAEAQRSGMISGFRIKSRGAVAVVSKSRLSEFIRSSVSLMAARIESAPRVECTVSVRDGLIEGADEEAQVAILLSSSSRCAVSTLPLGLFISRERTDAYMALERLALSLGAAMSFPDSSSIRLAIPAGCRYDKESDLVEPLHIMLERARLTNSEFSLISVRSIGGIGDRDAFEKKLARSLVELFSGEKNLVSQGELQGEFSLFCVGKPVDEVEKTMESLRSDLSRWSAQIGNELHPTLRWQVVYHRDASQLQEDFACPSLEFLVN